MPTVLVVDDAAVDRRLIAGVLEKSSQMKVVTVANGAEAVAKLAELSPDVIVTDLTMPEMDGLQLVTMVRVHYPRIPVILVTAHGSEALAVKALEQGAASYVPKSQLAQKLLDTVEHVLARTSADQSYQRLTACMTSADFRFRIPSDERLVERLIDLVQAMTVSMALVEPNEQVRLGMGLEEALQAAIYQGNLELTADQLFDLKLNPQGAKLLDERRESPQFVDRHLEVRIQFSAEEARFTITHEGAPLAFDVGHAEAAINQPAQRTAVLMQAMMDEFSVSPDGKTMTLVKRKRT